MENFEIFFLTSILVVIWWNKSIIWACNPEKKDCFLQRKFKSKGFSSVMQRKNFAWRFVNANTQRKWCEKWLAFGVFETVPDSQKYSPNFQWKSQANLIRVLDV